MFHTQTEKKQVQFRAPKYRIQPNQSSPEMGGFWLARWCLPIERKKKSCMWLYLTFYINAPFRQKKLDKIQIEQTFPTHVLSANARVLQQQYVKCHGMNNACSM